MRATMGKLTLCVAAGLWAGAALPLAVAAAQNSVAGEAFGASVNSAAAAQGKTPLAVLVPDSGVVTAEQPSLTVTSAVIGGVLAAGLLPGGTLGSSSNALSTGPLGSTSAGVVGENAASSESNTVVQNVNILSGVVTATRVGANAASASNGIQATSNAAGSAIWDLAVNGVFMGDVQPAPNTRINVPGVGAVILNEQVPSGDGVHTSGLQVNMIHVVQLDPVTGAKTGDIIVGSATSSVGFTR